MATQQEQKSAATAVAPAPVEAEEFAQVLKGNFKPRTERAATEVENAIQTLVTQALADSSLVKGEVLDTIEEMIARLDEKLSAQMNEVLHAPEFQQLESAWRGLNYLVFNSETDATLKIRVMNVGKMELYRNLKNNYPGARWDQSPLFKAVYESEFGTLGGEPYGALVADYAFSHNAVDVQLLRDLSKIASASLAPLVTGADPNLLGMDSLAGSHEPARHRKADGHAGLRRLEGTARFRRQPLCRSVHAARAVAPALWREDGAGRGIRVRGRYGRQQGREIWLDERSLRDGNEHQSRLQGIRLDGANSRRRIGRRGA